MSKIRKIMYFVLFLIVFVTGYSFYYFNEYHIDNDNISIQSDLKDWLNRGGGEEFNPNVLDVVRLDHSNSYIVLFQIENDNIGYAHLIKGLNGKFEMKGSGGYGTNVASYRKIETNKGTYGILF